jgi:hypothetical protein
MPAGLTRIDAISNILHMIIFDATMLEIIIDVLAGNSPTYYQDVHIIFISNYLYLIHINDSQCRSS